MKVSERALYKCVGAKDLFAWYDCRPRWYAVIVIKMSEGKCGAVVDQIRCRSFGN